MVKRTQKAGKEDELTEDESKAFMTWLLGQGELPSSLVGCWHKVMQPRKGSQPTEANIREQADKMREHFRKSRASIGHNP